ncbi:MAG: type III polyketide synthase [Balneolaceae bacterium]|nr:type III polyketide synthase [Balneolaceae bacterium]
MAVFIHNIATSVPPHAVKQQRIREIMKQHLASNRKTKAIIHRIYSQSGIEKRHSVLEDFIPNNNGALFFNGEAKTPPGTKARNDMYEQEATPLFLDVSQKLLDDNKTFDKDDITHVITVSCTGFFAPGPDFQIVKSLGLKPQTQRFHIGFMGCYAAFPALKMAQSFCMADPKAVVLVVCAELCSLHFQFGSNIDELLSGSVFADGAAGLLVSSKQPEKPAFSIDKFATSLVFKGEQDMAWSIGDSGFDMVLSTYVPNIIRDNIEEVVQPLYDQYEAQKEDIDYWALHPGGRAILDKIQSNLQLKPPQISASRKVLAEYGNMSSATVLFVLKELLNTQLKEGDKILPVAFGPGLTIESGLLTFHQTYTETE